MKILAKGNAGLFLFAIALLHAVSATSAPTSLADSPLATDNSTVAVKPNIAFVVDDSLSMVDENMPGDDGDNKSKRCWGWYKYNTLAYNPNVTYKPPYKPDGETYSDGVKRYPDAIFSSALVDGYFPLNGNRYEATGTNTAVDLGTTSNLSPNAVTCSGAIYTATITLINTGSGNNNKDRAKSLKVGGVELFSSSNSSIPSTSTNQADTLGPAIANAVQRAGYSASYDATTNVLTITSTNATSAGVTPVLTMQGSQNPVSATTAFDSTSVAECTPDSSGKSKYYYSSHRSGDADASCAAGDSNYSIVAFPSSISAPGVATGSAGALKNYANWYSYYRKRAYTMKAATAEAFRGISEGYRVGLFFIASNQSGADDTKRNDDLIIDDFSGTHRTNWFSRLLGHRVAYSTPLRGALARMGRMFAGQISGWDPVQYSCQQNFTILSTDGYWNDLSENNSYGPLQITGTSKVGNVDGSSLAASSSITVATGLSNSNRVGISSITVNGVELLGSAIPRQTSSATLAGLIASGISQAGYSASVDASNQRKVNIVAPLSAGALTATPVVTLAANSANGYLTVTPFTGYSAGASKPYSDINNISNTLADVAYYYYINDLRTPGLNNCTNTIGSTNYTELCTNNVTGAGRDINNQQHMTTFSIGLGVSGSISYPNSNQYLDNNSWNAWPDPGNPSNISGPIEKIDDLWHAAVNGRGSYYSASNSTTLAAGIQEALAGVEARVGSSSASATSTLELTTEDHQVFQALYRTVNWDGDLRNCSIDPTTGVITKDSNNVCVATWNAQATLDSQVASAGASADGRTIKYFSTGSGNTNQLKDFTYSNLNADGKGSLFANACSKSPALQQCNGASGVLNSTQVALANGAENLINYLRGRATYEREKNSTDPLYRKREHILGDVVNAVPVFVKAPVFEYGQVDSTYSDFKTDNAARDAVVYAAANDGMLHAFSVSDGTEKWAFVPSFVMSKMYRLADYNYSSNHVFLADGSPTVADVCSQLVNNPSSLPAACRSKSYWKTILVAGLNKGGCGYYALDVTDPNSPKGLWEFSDENLGYSFGNPVITRRKDGRWVVVISSGYNNYPGGCGSTGDGNGHVFVLDALTGEKLEDIQTMLADGSPAGTVGSPNGLAKLNAWVESPYLNVADRIYGGDLLGNVWRIDFDNNAGATGKEAMLLGNLTAGGHPQPITTKPELYYLSSVGGYLVLVGTGKYLGVDDPLNTDQQSIYGLKDNNSSTGLGDVRNNNSIVSRTLEQTTDTSGALIRKINQGADINWASNNGWYIDLNPDNTAPTERINVDMQLQYNLLTVATNVPYQSACTQGGSSWKFDIDIETGKAVITASDGAIATFLGNSLVAGIKVVKLDTGQTITIVTDTSGKIFTRNNPSPSGGGTPGIRRTMWREIFD